MRYIKRIHWCLIILALFLVMIPLQAHADDDDVQMFDVVGWYDENNLGAVTSVKVNGVELSEFEMSQYVPVPELNTVMVEPSSTLTVEITLQDGYALSSAGGSVLYTSGVQSWTDHITGSTSAASIQVPAADWYGKDEELYLAFRTVRSPQAGGSITTLDSIEFTVENSIDCKSTVNIADVPVPIISIPAGSGFKMIPDSICWMKKEATAYLVNHTSFYAVGNEAAVFKVDITDVGPYVFSETLDEKGIKINHGELLDYDMFTYGGPDPESTVHELCLTVSVELNHVWDEGKVITKATKYHDGEELFTCTRCGGTKTEVIPRLDATGTLMAKITAKGKTSLVLTWDKIDGADGYDVYFSNCSKKSSPKFVKSIKGNKTRKWTKKGLSRKTAYKARVKAWIMQDGEKKYIRTSPIVHAYTGGSIKDHTNSKAVTVKKTKVSLRKKQTYKITDAKVIKVDKKKKLMREGHAPELRYLSSNKKIATVTSKGKIKAKSKGSCYVYVYAVNGAYKKIKVTVK